VGAGDVEGIAGFAGREEHGASAGLRRADCERLIPGIDAGARAGATWGECWPERSFADLLTYRIDPDKASNSKLREPAFGFKKVSAMHRPFSPDISSRTRP
jgi:hypothetical protein